MIKLGYIFLAFFLPMIVFIGCEKESTITINDFYVTTDSIYVKSAITVSNQGDRLIELNKYGNILKIKFFESSSITKATEDIIAEEEYTYFDNTNILKEITKHNYIDNEEWTYKYECTFGNSHTILKVKEYLDDYELYNTEYFYDATKKLQSKIQTYSNSYEYSYFTNIGTDTVGVKLISIFDTDTTGKKVLKLIYHNNKLISQVPDGQENNLNHGVFFKYNDKGNLEIKIRDYPNITGKILIDSCIYDNNDQLAFHYLNDSIVEEYINKNHSKLIIPVIPDYYEFYLLNIPDIRFSQGFSNYYLDNIFYK